LRGAVAIAVSLSLHKESYSNVMAGGREIIFEFVRVGGSVKVTALDVASGVEVSIVGPASAGEASLKRLAKQKLDYVMAKGTR